jgi:tetratricopeptide (TPR) repeat protein
MRAFRKPFVPLLLAAASLLAGCADLPGFGGAAPARAHPSADAMARQHVQREPAALREGIHLYNEGDYNAAIKRLSSDEIADAPTGVRVKALKYTAFSYCVTNRAAQCQHAFEKALKLDPSFELAPGEHGHPLWGPVFAKAKNGR